MGEMGEMGEILGEGWREREREVGGEKRQKAARREEAGSHL